MSAVCAPPNSRLPSSIFSDQLRTRNTLRRGELCIGIARAVVSAASICPRRRSAAAERERDWRIVTNAERVAPGYRGFQLVAVSAVS